MIKSSSILLSLAGKHSCDVICRSKTLRFRVTDQVTQAVKLETTFPAGFLDSIPAFIPALAGIDLAKLLSSAQPDQLGGRAIADFTNDGDRVQIFLQ